MKNCRIIIDGVSLRGTGLKKTTLAEAARYFAFRSASRIKLPFREVTVVLQDDISSDEAHQAIMNVCGATDVITQRYDAMPGEEDGVYGELYVNVQRAVSYAKNCPRWSAENEVLLYVAHGMDHLSGADDMTETDRRKMRRRELAWIKAFLSTIRDSRYCF